MQTSTPQQRRHVRLLCLTLLIAGSIATALVLTGVKPFDASGIDGTLIFPVAAIIGLAGLIALRPRTTNRKDRRNG